MTLTPETAALAVRLKLATDARIDGITSKLAAAWSAAWDEIAQEWREALEDLADAAEDGQWPTRAQIARAERAQKALRVAEDALMELSRSAEVTITGDLPGLVDLAEQQQRRMVGAQFPRNAGTQWDRIDPRAVQAIVERSTAQVTSLLWPLAPEATAAMKSALIRGVVVGDNPRSVARDMLTRVRGAFDGGCRRAETIARTEMADAHRAAAQRSQAANADVLQGWRWTTALSDRTCPACLAMHGQVFALDVPGPEGHPSCRCARTPLARPWADLGITAPEPSRTAPTGVEWLEAQPEVTQRAILGDKRYTAWQAGTHPPEQWAVRQDNPGWRPSYVPGKLP